MPETSQAAPARFIANPALTSRQREFVAELFLRSRSVSWTCASRFYRPGLTATHPHAVGVYAPS